jgi:hypothetical protein
LATATVLSLGLLLEIGLDLLFGSALFLSLLLVGLAGHVRHVVALRLVRVAGLVSLGVGSDRRFLQQLFGLKHRMVLLAFAVVLVLSALCRFRHTDLLGVGSHGAQAAGIVLVLGLEGAFLTGIPLGLCFFKHFSSASGNLGGLLEVLFIGLGLGLAEFMGLFHRLRGAAHDPPLRSGALRPVKMGRCAGRIKVCADATAARRGVRTPQGQAKPSRTRVRCLRLRKMPLRPAIR